jgi:hypothetical protein
MTRPRPSPRTNSRHAASAVDVPAPIRDMNANPATMSAIPATGNGLLRPTRLIT